MNKIFLHVDLDAFFASVEQLDHPEYRGKPVIVGGLPSERRGVVSTASYEARKFSVHSAMPIYQAVKLCPHGIFIHPNMKRYHEKSEEVMAIFRNYSPDVQQISVDEAFIDLTGTEKLFGPAEETARRLKKEVLEKTGLTVSVGLASTKYCAKIASALQKPDGLTVVPFGKEEEFMLSLPLTKVWGAGKKTLEKLENYGIRSTKDIYDRSEKLLQTIFGNAAGSFLYNAVRGNENENFNSDPKSRSISAETTYSYDLTDKDAIETSLLALCYTVFFRSLKEKVRSSCVSLKIRYDDFTTVNIQSTGERYISSVDDLFQKAKALFYKKYDGKRAIRLFGIALQNIEDESTPRQQELFDFGEEKKRKVENAILKAKEKNPSLKITRARLLGSSFLFLFFLFFAPENIFAELPVDTKKESDGAGSLVFDTSKLPLSDSGNFVSLFNKDFGNQNVEFFAEGYWKSTVTGSASYSFGFGTSPVFSTTTPVFTQNVDLSLYFMLNHHWYFEAAFADEFTKNTVAAGYIGNGYLKSLRLSNRKIVFPSIYSVSDVNRGIGGGENQAPGISANWAGKKWQSDAVLRYDLLQSKEKSWYGKNSVSISEIALSSYNTGNQYFLPDSSMIQNIKNVYVESNYGTYKDSKGRQYTKLDASQYLLLASKNMLLLSKDAKAYRKNKVLPAVAISFYSSPSQSDFGDYNDNSTFLGKIQEWFSEDHSILLEKYSYNLFNSINGEEVLYIQHPAGFSPFMFSSRYDCGLSSASDAQVANSSTGTADTTYTAIVDEDNIKFAETDFFYSNHLYADLYLTDEDSDSDEITGLIHSAFPLANEYPKVYLQNGINEDLCLQIRSFTPVNRLDIGNNAVAGTVNVYKNGVIDPSARYDEESGIITLSSAVSSQDHIKAIWYEESEDSESGAISWATAFKYDFTEKLSGDISASSRWSYNPEREYADSQYSSTGFVTAATKIAYTGEAFSAKNTAAATYENTNTTGIYRILGNDDSDSDTYYFPKNAAIDLPQGFAPTLNEKTSENLISNIELQDENNGSMEANDGSNDTAISGYAIPLEWNFEGITAGTGENQAWAAITLSTPGLSANLSNASTFSIAIKNPHYDETFDNSNVSLYLQLGVSDDDDFLVEESDKIPTWKISDSSSLQVKRAFNFSQSGYQIITVILSDEDRSIISSLQNFNARLILTSSSSSALPSQGIIYAGPYESGEMIFNFSSEADVNSINYQEKDASLSSSKIKKFNSSSSNKVQYFEWNFSSSPASDEELTFTRYFAETDLSNYKKLSFFMRGENVSWAKITLSRPKSSAEEKTLVYEIQSLSSEWKEYEINLTENNDSNLTYIDTDKLPTKLTITIATQDDGFLYFDELYLSENSAFLVLQDKLESSYEIKGNIISKGKYEILKDFSISVSGSGATSIDTEKRQKKENSIESSGNLSFTVTNIKFSAGTNFSNAYEKDNQSDITQKNILSSASHVISSENAFFDLLSFSENYIYNAEEGSLEKSNDIKIDLSKYLIPISIQGNTNASSDIWSLNQKSNLICSLKAGNFSMSANANLSQKILTDSTKVTDSLGKDKFETVNYFSSWEKITAFSFDKGDEKASKRSVKSKASADYNLEIAGLKPSLFFETSGVYKSSNENSFTDSVMTGFEIPFSFAKNNFSVSWKKYSGSTDEISKGGNYEKDLENLGKSLNEKNYFFKSMPVYDLASKNLATEVLNTERESNYYTGAYAFNWRRSFYANKYDFIIPQSVKLEARRDIRTGTSTSDFYQIKNTAGYTALNIFGRNGNIPLFSFLSSDEYNSSISGAVKIPRENHNQYSYVLNGYTQATFYFKSENYIKTGFEASYEGKDDWSTKYTFIWNRNSTSSLAMGIISIFSDKEILKITKSDSLNFNISSSSTSSNSPDKKYNLAYNHKTETQVTKYVSINTEVGIIYYAYWEKIAMLTASASLGATIKF